MLKESVSVRFSNKDIFKKKAGLFGNSSHVIIPKKYFGKRVKVLAGKIKVKGKYVNIDFSDAEIFNKEAIAFGTGCHVIIPREYSEKEVNLIIEK